MPETWPEVAAAKNENKHELILSGSIISNRIKKSGFDHSVFLVSSLNYLNISQTGLQSIPDDLSKLVNLQNLSLHSNNLESLPSTVGQLKKLKNLDVSRNKISILPSDISNLESLITLNANSNELVTVPCLSKNVNLSVVNLCNNKLTAFPDICYPELSHLSELILNKNSIESIPNTINSLSMLKVLDVASNQIKIVPGEISDISKLKDVVLSENPLSDKRLLKLVNQCHSKQIIDYIKSHCPRTGNENATKGGKKGKKGAGSKSTEIGTQKTDSNIIDELTHKISVLHVNDSVPNVIVLEDVKSIRQYILCCIVKDLRIDEDKFRKLIQMQTKLHDSVCEKRNAATIATHDFSKLSPGSLIYTAKPPKEILIKPLTRQKLYSAEDLYLRLKAEADEYRKEKKRNVYSGIHKYLHLLEGKTLYPCLLDSKNEVISFPPITNSDVTKISTDTTSIFIEVTSATGPAVCRKVLDTLLYDMLLLGIGDIDSDVNNDDIQLKNSYHLLRVQQVKIVDKDGNLKAVYPSRSDLIYDDKNVSVLRE